jgi:hypothetical protein
LDVKAKGSAQDAALRFDEREFNRAEDRLKRGSALSRLAIVLFTTGLALLIVGFFAQ